MFWSVSVSKGEPPLYTTSTRHTLEKTNLSLMVEGWHISLCHYWIIARDPSTGVTTSRATSGGWRKDRNTSGQRRNKFSTSYRDISVIVGENNSVVRPKYQQYTSLNKMLSNFSKVLMAHISFTAVINNRGIGKGIGGIRKGTKKNYIYVL